LAQIHHVKVVAAELAQALLDLPAQLIRPRQPADGGTDLGSDDQIAGVWGQCPVGSFRWPSSGA
jgi:hypothetical protein